MAAALETSDLSPDQKEKLKVIRDSGDLLMMVLNDLLDFSKIEANKLSLENAPYRFDEIAERVERLHSLKAREKGLEFSVNCIGDCASARIGDDHRILQVMHNLVSNAIKFTDEGKVCVRVEAPDGDNDMARITVSDTGIGLSPEQIERVFEPFMQADVTTTRKYGGTGLGLAITKQLVEAMGGEVYVESALGEGARFTAIFPAPLAEDEHAPASVTPMKANQPPAMATAPVSGLRILVGEDNAVNRAVLNVFLNQRGHEVTYADDGLQTVKAFEAGQFDVVLMDISMPGLDGPEAMRRIRGIEDRRGDAPTPVIAVSAHAMQQQIDEYLALGFDGYVTKPVRAELLHAEIDRVMAKFAGRTASFA